MAVKFSQFVVETDKANVNYLVGWDGVENVQITPSDLLSGFNIGSTNDVAYFASSNSVIGDATTPFVYQPTGGGGQPAGRLGLGTSSPNFKMDISGGDLRFENNDGIRFGGTGSNNTNWRIFTTGTTTGNLSIGNSASTPYLTISRGSSTTGFVGIGTSSPGALLQVDGTFISSGLSQLGSGGANVLLTSSSAGNVGIGTSSPATKLEVDGLISGKSGAGLGYTFAGDLDTSIENPSANTIVFKTTGAERMRIASDGNLGIGTSSPSAKLHVSGSDSTASAIRQSRVGTVIWDQAIDSSGRLQWGTRSSEGGSRALRFTLDDNGNVGIGTGSPSENLQVGGGTGNHTILISSQTSLYKATTTGTGEAALYLADGNQDWRIQKKNNEDNLTIRNETTGDDVIVIDSVTNNATFAGDITLGANHIGRDGDNYIDFETDNLIKFRVNGATQVKIADGTLAPQTDSDIDLGSNSTRFKNAYVDTITTTGDATFGGNLNVTGSTTLVGLSANSVTTPTIQLQGDLNVLNKAQTSYITLADRDTSGSEVVYNLSNLGTATFAGNVSVTGNISLTGKQVFENNQELRWKDSGGTERTILELTTADDLYFGGSFSGSLIFVGGGSYTERFRINDSGNVAFPDNGKLLFGAGSDLSIYHDGTHSFISDQGSGNLTMLASTLIVNNAADTENMIIASSDGSVNLYYDGSQKFRTISAGAEVTGTLNTDNLTIAGDQGSSGDVLTSTGSGVAWQAGGGGGATDLNGLTDCLVDTDSLYVGESPSSLSGNPQGNTTLGIDAGVGLTTGFDNTFIGRDAAKVMTDSDQMVVIGSGAGQSSTSNGDRGTIIGFEAHALSMGSRNVTIGYQSMRLSGVGNSVAIGYQAGRANTSAGSTFVGYQSGENNQATGAVFVGFESGFSNTSGASNTNVGYQAGYSNTTSAYRTMMGYEAGEFNTGANNTFIGYHAGTGVSGSSTADRTTIIGSEAGEAITTGLLNVLIGYQAGKALTVGGSNVAVGTEALKSENSRSFSVAVGTSALTAQDANANAYNAALGHNAGNTITTGVQNTCIGGKAGADNSLITGSNNTIIGYDAQPSADDVDNEITLGNSSIATIRAQVQTISSLSDKRDKTNIEDSPYGLDLINSLNPVTFDWNMRDGAKVGQKDLGFIAQDLQELDDEHLQLVYSNNPEKLEASYGRLIPVLVKAIQDLSAKVTALENAQ